MGSDSGFRETQNTFIAYIRDPLNSPPPADIEVRRMELYKTLFFNNIESFLANSFPVLRKILDDQPWEALIREFYSKHKSHTPYFAEIPEEFIAYLENERGIVDGDFPFLLELAHYEWVELALANADIDDSGKPGQVPCEDLLSVVFAVSPLLWPLAYRYPVHQIGESFIPEECPREPTFLAVYRDSAGCVRFTEINSITYRLLQSMESGSIPLCDHLSALAGPLVGADRDAIIRGGVEIVREFLTRGSLYPVE